VARWARCCSSARVSGVRAALVTAPCYCLIYDMTSDAQALLLECHFPAPDTKWTSVSGGPDSLDFSARVASPTRRDRAPR